MKVWERKGKWNEYLKRRKRRKERLEKRKAEKFTKKMISQLIIRKNVSGEEKKKDKSLERRKKKN